MNVRNGFAPQIPTPKLDPLLVGKVMGVTAFSEGDWVLLRYWDNTPTKVKQIQHNFIYVGLEGEETFGDTLIHFYPEELGYPLDHRFWSKHQKQCYLKCHMDRTLLHRWEGKPQVIRLRGSEWKIFDIGHFDKCNYAGSLRTLDALSDLSESQW